MLLAILFAGLLAVGTVSGSYFGFEGDGEGSVRVVLTLDRGGILANEVFRVMLIAVLAWLLLISSVLGKQQVSSRVLALFEGLQCNLVILATAPVRGLPVTAEMMKLWVRRILVAEVVKLV